eukprot:1109263-Amorphochlora_amoeboformis.AAC.1
MILAYTYTRNQRSCGSRRVRIEFLGSKTQRQAAIPTVANYGVGSHASFFPPEPSEALYRSEQGGYAHGERITDSALWTPPVQ